MDDVWKLLHVLTGFWFVAGLVGRNVSIAQARSEEAIGRVEALMTAAGRFERLMVIPGSAAVLVLGIVTMLAQGWSFLGEGNRWLPTSVVLFVATAALVPIVFLPRGRVFEQAFADAKREGTVTPALSGAFADPAVAWARRAELAAVAVVIALMVLKPFWAAHRAGVAGAGGRSAGRGAPARYTRQRWPARADEGARLESV